MHDLSYSRALANPDMRGSEEVTLQLPPVSHPVVRETAVGPTLFLGAHASHVVGMDIEEGRDLICQLNERSYLQH